MEKRFFCAEEKSTHMLGLCLGKQLQAGNLICLQGQLGAGKTTFAKAVAAGMGFTAEQITSPTFTIMNVYEGSLTLQHFDLYRLDTDEELEVIGFAEYLAGRAVSLVEWADLFPHMLPEEKLTIKIEIAENGREFIFQPNGSRYEQLCQEVSDAYTGP